MNKFKRLLWDISGAFGDIGVLFPIAVALIAKNGFNPTALFLMAGLFYMLSARYFRLTMPVQPLKAMAAIAIATGLGFGVINAAGVVMGLILILLAATGLSEKLGRFFPVSIVRGIQLGLGLMLMKASVPLMATEGSIAFVTAGTLIVCLLFVRSIPPLIPILVLGFVISVGRMEAITLGPIPLDASLPTLQDMKTAIVLLVLPQLALTFGNSIVATEATGKLLYGLRARRLTLRSIPLSIGMANIVSGIIGGAPMCHGSGGLTAHNKFGASTERSGYVIGGVLVVLALLFGNSSMAAVAAFPKGILGVLLFYVGIQHSLFIRDILGDLRAMTIALSVAVIGFAFGNLSYGFLVGFAVYYTMAAIDKTAFAIKGQHGGGNV